MRAQWGDSELTKHDGNKFVPVNAAAPAEDWEQIGSESEIGDAEADVEDPDYEENIAAAEEFIHEHETLAAEWKAGLDRKLFQARQAVAEHRTSRGFYPSGQGPSTRPPIGPAIPRGQQGGGFRPGQALAARRPFGQARPSGRPAAQPTGNRGCFICGGLGHIAKDCPKRYAKGKVHFNDEVQDKPADENDTIGLAVDDVNFMAMDCGSSNASDLTDNISELECMFEEAPELLGDGEFELVEDVPPVELEHTKPDMSDYRELIIFVSNIFNVTLQEAKVIVDSGATETVGSPEAIDALITKVRTRNPSARVTTDPAARPQFRFGNGSTGRAYSRVGVHVPWGVFRIFAVEAPGVPILLSVRTLRDLKANIDFCKDTMQFCLKGQTLSSPLERSEKGHLLLDIANPVSCVVESVQ